MIVPSAMASVSTSVPQLHTEGCEAGMCFVHCLRQLGLKGN